MSNGRAECTYRAVMRVDHQLVADPAELIKHWPDIEEGSQTLVEVLLVRDDEVLTQSTGEPGPWMATAWASARYWAGRMADEKRAVA